MKTAKIRAMVFNADNQAFFVERVEPGLIWIGEIGGDNIRFPCYLWPRVAEAVERIGKELCSETYNEDNT